MDLQVIQQRIFEIKGQKVMLDYDLAVPYEVETKVFNQAVKRNTDNFSADSMFQLTLQVWEAVQLNWSQFVTSSVKYRGGKYLPLTSTEHGGTMLASILKSEKARKMNIAIVRAFIAMRSFVLQHERLTEQIGLLKKRSGSHDKQLNQI